MTSNRNALSYKTGSKPADSDTWLMWAQMPMAPLWKVVALHCGLDPDSVTIGGLLLQIEIPRATPDWYFHRRHELAVAHVKNGSLQCFERKEAVPQSFVRLDVYAAWAESLGEGHELPERFPRIQLNQPMANGSDSSNGKWPWGSYETPLLRDLAMAGERWRLKSEGGTYDPTDSTTGPKSKDDMIPWLISKGVLPDNAKAIARILNDPSIPPGPRRRKRQV
jgi:hypothetical protein